MSNDSIMNTNNTPTTTETIQKEIEENLNSELLRKLRNSNNLDQVEVETLALETLKQMGYETEISKKAAKKFSAKYSKKN